jgi:hypothetical protein
MGFFDAVKNFFEDVGEAAAEVANDVGQQAGQLFDAGVEAATETAEAAGNQIGSTIEAAARLLAGGDAGAALGQLGQETLANFVPAVSAIGEAGKEAADLGVASLNGANRLLGEANNHADELIDGAISDAGDILNSGLEIAGDTLTKGAPAIIDGLVDVAVEGAAVGFEPDALGAIIGKEAIELGVALAPIAAAETVEEIIEKGPEFIKDTGEMIGAGLDAAGNVLEGYRDGFKDGTTLDDPIVTGTAGGSTQGQGLAAGGANRAFGGALDEIGTSIDDLLDKLKAEVVDLVPDISGKGGEPLGLALNGVGSQVESIAGREINPALQAAIEELKDRLDDGSLTKFDPPFELPKELPPSFTDKLPDLGPFDPRGSVVGSLKDDIIDASGKSELISGGKGADSFRFDSIEDSRPGAMDRIMDFSVGDKIDLSGIDAMISKAGDQAFSYVEAGSKMGAGMVSSYFDAKSGMTIVEAHTNNDGVADFSMELAGNVALTKNDFVL